MSFDSAWSEPESTSASFHQSASPGLITSDIAPLANGTVKPNVSSSQPASVSKGHDKGVSGGAHRDPPPPSQNGASPARVSSRPRPSVTYNLKELKRMSMSHDPVTETADDRGEKRRRTVAGYEVANGARPEASPRQEPKSTFQKRSEVSKARWASGLMQKALETRRRIREQKALATGAQKTASGTSDAQTVLPDQPSSETSSYEDSSSDELHEDDQSIKEGRSNHTRKQTEQWDDNDPVAIELASPGRPYRNHRDESGKLVPSHGALIPHGYRMMTVPGYPWVCPVRSCRMLFRELSQMGHHWVGGHRTCLLNDNGDGTLSVVGKYDNAGHTAPAIVISKRPLDPKEPLMAAPQFPDNDRVSESHQMEDVLNSIEPLNGESALTVIRQAGEMWKYVRKFLTKYKEMPNSDQIKNLLPLPRVREIVWNKEQSFIDKHNKDITSLLVQLTGDEAPEPCTRCQQRRGPYIGCVVMTSKVPIGTVLACGNCCYHGNQTRCSLKNSMLQRAKNEGEKAGGVPSQSLTHRASVALGSHMLGLDGNSQSSKRADSSSTPVEPKTYRRPDPDTPHGGGQANGSNGRKTMVDTLRQSGRLNILYQQQQRKESTVDSSHTSNAGESSLISQGDLQRATPNVVLEMEQWERGPGKVISNSSSQWEVDHVAFSKPFLSAGHEIQVCPEASFKVQTIRSGMTHRFDPSDDTTRLCSIASGKLKVKIEGEDEFVLGPHGMFKVKHDVGCTVENQLYLDVIMHITTIKSWL